MGRTLQTDKLMLQPRIWQGPATVLLEDIVRNDDRLRSQTTSTWMGAWAEKPFDFPNLYIGNDPFPVRLFDPINTYSNDQNSRYNQRQPAVVPYLQIRPTPWAAMSGPGRVKYIG
jgi:hypothetical protein